MAVLELSFGLRSDVTNYATLSGASFYVLSLLADQNGQACEGQRVGCAAHESIIDRESAEPRAE